MKKIASLILSILISKFAFSQTAFVRDLSIPLYQYGIAMQLPYAGGINGAMTSAIDLNFDGINDLFIFEKDQVYKKARFTTYINNGTPNQTDYVYAPEYIDKFPVELADWAILVDYNFDGLPDIFTYSNKIPAAGVTVYKNISANGVLQFQLEYPLLYAIVPSGIGNVYVSSLDKPSIVDFDGDGDMDFIGVVVGGGKLEWHKNIAMETLGRNDTLIYEWMPSCWGHFVFSPTNNAAFLNVACKPAPVLNTKNENEPTLTKEPAPDPSRHSGTCFILEDLNNDSLVDYLGGDAISNSILYLQNGGTLADPNMVWQDTLFPIYDVPAFYFEFLDPSRIDVNNDGLKDLLVSPCKNGDAENYHSLWYYKNVGVAGVDSFSYQLDNFLINQMVDVGEAAQVSFFDADADGLMDIMVGNQGYYDGFTNVGGINYPVFQSGIAWYKNTGTATAPAFSLQTIDWMNLFSLSINAMHPTFGDLDGDGDKDMIIGEETGKLYYFENTAGPGNPADFSNPPTPYYFTIDVGKYATPQLIDMNKDNLLDIVSGNELGKLRYFENIGTATAPFFNNNNVDFGNVNVSQGLSAKGQSDPYVYRNASGNTVMLVSNERGNIFYYDNIDNNLGGTFTQVDTFYKKINEPVKATIDGYDINGDNLLDLIVGNQSGGFVIYKQVSTAGIAATKNMLNSLVIYPIPAKNEITIKLNEQNDFGKLTITIYDSNGKIVYYKQMTDYYDIVNLKDASNGIYICKVTDTTTGDYFNSKFIISK